MPGFFVFRFNQEKSLSLPNNKLKSQTNEEIIAVVGGGGAMPAAE